MDSGFTYLVGADDEVEAAAERLRGAGFEAEPFDVLPTSDLPADGPALPDVDYRDLGGIFFTSGTTGLSKGVEM